MKREINSNHRLIITPDLFRGTNDKAARALLDDMTAQIRRHVDYVGTVKVECDTRAECSFCGREWEVADAETLASFPGDYVLGQPVCCDKASAEFLWAQARTGGA